MDKRNGIFYAPDEPSAPGGTPAAPAAPAVPATPAAPSTPAAPAAPAAPVVVDPAAEWRATFGDTVKPADVLAKLREQHAKLQAPAVPGASPAPAAPAAPVDIKELIFDDPEKALDAY